MEALPICINMLVPEYMAILLAVTAVLIFGEILPQAVCTGPNQIAIAATLAPVVRTLMIMEGPIAHPIALMLDCFLGKHTTNRYKNTDLKALIELHTQNAVQEMEKEKMKNGMGLSHEQTKLITGAIDLTSYFAKDAMKPYEKVETISWNQVLTRGFLNKLTEQGYSRYPVYKGDKHNVMGILLVKKLLGFNKFDVPLEKLNILLRMPLIVQPDMALTELLMEFQKGKSHIALVTRQTYELRRKMGLEVPAGTETMRFDEAMATDPVEIMGIITLEDVVEKVIGDPILDEDDYDKEHLTYLQPGAMGRRAEIKELGKNMDKIGLGAKSDLESSRKQLCDDLINKKGSAL
jgi:metal transporter CNNM